MQMPVERNASDVYEIGENIRKLRKAQGLSQDGLADRMGTSRNEVYRHENGLSEMSICTLCQYADALETTPQQLSPGRFRQDSLAELLGRLSEGSRQMIQDMAEHLLDLESKMQHI